LEILGVFSEKSIFEKNLGKIRKYDFKKGYIPLLFLKYWKQWNFILNNWLQRNENEKVLWKYENISYNILKVFLG